MIVNGTLSHIGPYASSPYKINLTILTNLTINTGGSINVSRKGFYSGYGPGNSR